MQAIPHGDASPQNLLVPADAPDTSVVIDPSFRTPHCLGFDLGPRPSAATSPALVTPSTNGSR